MQSSLLSFLLYISHHLFLLMRHRGRIISCLCLSASLVDCTPADQRSHSDASFWCKEEHVVTSNRGNRRLQRLLMDSSGSRGSPSCVMNLQWHNSSCQIKLLCIMGGKGQIKWKQHLESIHEILSCGGDSPHCKIKMYLGLYVVWGWGCILCGEEVA